MKSKLIILLLGILNMGSQAQTSFIKHYGEFSGKGNSIIINSNGHYIIAGTKTTTHADQFFTVELNNIGDTLWLKDYGTDSVEEASQVIQTIDGGLAIVGYTADYLPGYRSIYFVKTTNTGAASWVKKIDLHGNEIGNSIVQTSSGDYFLSGTSYLEGVNLYDVFLIKTDVNGDTLWTKKYGGSLNEESTSMKQTSDGGLIISGYSQSFSFGSTDFYLVKTDSIGDTLWTRHYGGSLEEKSNSVRQTSDGGYIMTGYSQSFGVANENMYVVKTNSLGDTVWTNTYGKAGRYSRGRDIIQTVDGGYIVTGSIKTASSNGAYDLYVVKINALGNVQWDTEYKVEPSNTSYTSSEGRSILQTPDGGFAISGTWFSASTFELLFVKLNADGTVGIAELPNYSICNVFPNPFSTSAILKCENFRNKNYTLTIFDQEGRNLRTSKYESSDYIEIEKGNLSIGLYYFQLRSDKEIRATGKFIIQ